MIQPVDTFVIRLWSPADLATGAGDDPRGVASHVGTGRAAAFRDGGELLSLLRELPRTAGAGDDSHDADPDATGVEPA
jgi:hypothetical protein